MNVNDIVLSIRPILLDYQVDKAEVFGSVARGEETKSSDIDLLVKMPSSTTLIQFIRLKRALESKLSKKVDLVEYNSVNSKLAPYVFSKTLTVL